MSESKVNAGRLASLEAAYAKTLEENKLLRTIVDNTTKSEVILHHSGLGPDMVINTGDGKSVVLSGSRKHRTVRIPFEAYEAVKIDTDWFEKGYVYRDGEGDDNPNLILDLDAWFNDRDEKSLKDTLAQIDSPGTLNCLYDFTENARDPDTHELSGKYLFLRNTVAARMSDVMNIIVVEDSYEE